VDCPSKSEPLGHEAASADPRLLLLMDHSLDFIEFVGADGVILGVSSAITSLAGYDPKELVGRRYGELLHPDDYAVAERAFAALLTHGWVGPLTVRYRRKSGAWRTIEVTGRNFLRDPAARAIVVLTRDVTDELQAHQQLVEANAALHRLSQQLIAAQEAERAHLARELHDDVMQTLAGLNLSMATRRPSQQGAAADDRLEVWQRMVTRAIERLRGVALNLRPPDLDGCGLPAAVRAHVARAEEISSVQMRVDIDEDLGRLPPEVELACFRIIQESVANAVKHSRAHHLWIDIRWVDRTLCLWVRDDGRGFDVAVARGNAGATDRIGLQSMFERATLVGGHFEIVSAPGEGTEVVARFPVREMALAGPRLVPEARL